VPLILIFGVFYLLIIRPQNKKSKEHQEMVNNLKIGTKVITSSGIIGVVKEIDNKENQVEVEISQGVIVKMLRNSVSQLAENKIDNKAENKADKKVEKKSKKWIK
jgi:preprotein translocase subunit YajC